MKIYNFSYVFCMVSLIFIGCTYNQSILPSFKAGDCFSAPKTNLGGPVVGKIVKVGQYSYEVVILGLKELGLEEHGEISFSYDYTLDHIDCYGDLEDLK